MNRPLWFIGAVAVLIVGGAAVALIPNGLRYTTRTVYSYHRVQPPQAELQAARAKVAESCRDANGDGVTDDLAACLKAENDREQLWTQAVPETQRQPVGIDHRTSLRVILAAVAALGALGLVSAGLLIGRTPSPSFTTEARH